MLSKLKTPTLSEIKAANPEFFSRRNNKFFGTYKWSKSGHIVSSPGKHGQTSRRWVDYSTLELSTIWEITEDGTTPDGYRIHKTRRFLSVSGPEFKYQEIDHQGDFIGEPLTSEQFHAIPRV